MYVHRALSRQPQDQVHWWVEEWPEQLPHRFRSPEQGRGDGEEDDRDLGPPWGVCPIAGLAVDAHIAQQHAAQKVEDIVRQATLPCTRHYPDLTPRHHVEEAPNGGRVRQRHSQPDAYHGPVAEPTIAQ